MKMNLKVKKLREKCDSKFTKFRIVKLKKSQKLLQSMSKSLYVCLAVHSYIFDFLGYNMQKVLVADEKKL